MKKRFLSGLAVVLCLMMAVAVMPSAAFGDADDVSLTENDSDNPYPDIVAAIDAQKPTTQKQMTLYNASTKKKITGICSVCSMVTLLNRRLKADGKSGSFNVKDVIAACGGKNISISGTKVYATGYKSVWYQKTYKKNGVSYTAQIINTKTLKKAATSQTALYQYIALLLHEHPEGIILRCKYAGKSGGHVVVITKYAMVNNKIQLYVFDPVNNKPNIKLEDSYLYKNAGKGNMYKYVDFISVLKGSKSVSPFKATTVISVGEEQPLVPLFWTSPLSGTYTSSDPDCCTVSSGGILTGVNEGEATITATLFSRKCTAHVQVEQLYGYRISVAEDSVGLISPERTSADEYDEIFLSVSADAEDVCDVEIAYQLDGMEFCEYADVSDDGYRFVMPAADVTVSLIRHSGRAEHVFIHEPTLTSEGSCEAIMYCTRCGKDLIRVYSTLPKLKQCGDDLYCTYVSETHELIFIGSGDMWDYDWPGGGRPWDSVSEDIRFISLPDGMTRIGQCAFAGLSELEYVYIPDSVTCIGAFAFTSCTHLPDVTMSEYTERIEQKAFAGCESLTWIWIPDSVTALEDYVFLDCTGLQGISIGDGLSIIGNGAFSNCCSLESVAIPDNIISIDDEAFSGCTMLQVIEITGNVESIEWNAFENCNSLLYVYYRGTSADWERLAIEDGNDPLLNAEWHYCPVIRTQPKNTAAVIGKTVKLKVVAEDFNGGELSYQWYRWTPETEQFQEISSASGRKATYSIKATEKKNGNMYYCVVTGEFDSTATETVTLTTGYAPTITKQPVKKTATAGKRVTFKVTAKGDDLTYQWYYRTSSAAKWKKVTGKAGKKAAYSFTATAKKNGWQYRCLVKNPFGKVYTEAVKLKVK